MSNRLSYEAILDQIARYKEAGVIWNQENETLKYEISRLFEKEKDTFKDGEFLELVRYRNSDLINEIYNSFPYSAVHASAMLKKLDKLAKKFAAWDSKWVIAAREFATRWATLNAAHAELKPLIKKGRQPNPNRVTPERTLDNTGTCAICGKNVKMDGGKLVHHGYEVKWHQFVGGCFGVGYEPIEVSNVALIDYIAMLTKQIAYQETQLAAYLATVADGTVKLAMFKYAAKKHNADGKLFTRDEMEALEPTMFDKVSNEVVRDFNWMISEMTYSRKTTQNKLTVWAPRPLPDAK